MKEEDIDLMERTRRAAEEFSETGGSLGRGVPVGPRFSYDPFYIFPENQELSFSSLSVSVGAGTSGGVNTESTSAGVIGVVFCVDGVPVDGYVLGGLGEEVE